MRCKKIYKRKVRCDIHFFFVLGKSKGVSVLFFSQLIIKG